MALAVKGDFKKGPQKGNCFVCGIPGHFVKDCRVKKTAQFSKWGEKGHLDRASTRQRDGGKHESVAMCPTLATSEEEYWVPLTQWKKADILVESGCTDHVVTKIDAFLDFMPVQSVVRNTKGEAYPKTKWIFIANSKKLCMPDYSSNLLSVSRCTEWGHSFNFEKGNSCMKFQTGSRVRITQKK